MRPYIFYLLSLIFVFPNWIAAQPGFNIVDDLGLPTNNMMKMIVHNDTVIGYGTAYGGPGNAQQGLLLTKYDTLGNLLGHNLVLDSLGDHLAINNIWGEITAAPDGGFAMTAATFSRHNGVLVKVNDNLEVEFIREYVDTTLNSNFNYNLVSIDDGYLIFGLVSDSNLIWRPFIKRVDLLGNEIWNNYYGNPAFLGNIIDIKMMNDSVLVAGSVHHSTTNSPGPSRTKLYFIHIDGTLLDDWQTIPDAPMGFLRRINLLEDGGLLIYGYAFIERINNAARVQPSFTKLDQDLNILWTKRYGHIGGISWHIAIREVESTIDGNFIGAGENFIDMGDDPPLATGWLMKVSPEGDSIWSRLDQAPFPQSWVNTMAFGGVGVLSSGSIIAGGTAIEVQDHHIWLVKVTNDGCLETIDCGLVPTYSPVPQAEVEVFPNPCKESVNITVEEYPLKNAKVVLYDAIGQRHKVQFLQSGWNSLQLDGMQAGLYFYEIMEGKALLKSGKLVKVE